MSVHRSAGLLAPVVAAGLLVATAATAAQAAPAASISPPTITGPQGQALIQGPFAVGSTVTFSFSEDGVGTPVSYQYTLDGGAAQTVSAPSGAASSQIVIPQHQPGILLVSAVAADGSVSGTTESIIRAQLSPPAADEDLNGDGARDLLTVGGTKGLAPGLWLAPGDTAHPAAAKQGRLSVPAADIGINGTGFSPGADSPAEFDGAQVITGHFLGDGFQDIIAYFPAGNDAGGGVVLDGSGDGTPLDPFFDSEAIEAGEFADVNGDNPLQIVNAEAEIYGSGLPDLLAVNGDPAHGYYLDYYFANVPGGYFNTFADRLPTPDGTPDWNNWTLATLSYSGGTGMFLWKESTGALYLWAGLTPTDNGDGTGTLAFTQYKIASHWNKGQPLSTLEAADFNGDGVPDLWAVTPAGVATAYRVSQLSAKHAAVVTAGPPQKLVPKAAAAG